MPTIENFPMDLMNEHMAWHDTPVRKGTRSLANRGLDFLNFHHNFLIKVHAWFDAQPEAYRQQYDITPSWNVIPVWLKNDDIGWNKEFASEEHKVITLRTSLDLSFPSEDQFGVFIEEGLHNVFLHPACAAYYNEPDLKYPQFSHHNTWFYKIHGLIDFWRAHYRYVRATFISNHHFESAVSILFGVTHDGGGVLAGTDGIPHRIGPWNPASLLSTETKQTVIKLALNQLSEGVMEEGIKNELQMVIKKMK